MRSPEEIVGELWFSDSSTHLFGNIRTVRKLLQPKTLGVYGSRLDAANQKFRYASEQLLRVQQMVGSLQHGEFIYFNDADRLTAHSALEAHLIFLRASIDLVVAAWWAYYSDTTNLDSFNDLLKKLSNNAVPWFDALSEESRQYWDSLKSVYAAKEFNWLGALIGRDRGQSLRDLAVHRSVLQLSTKIDENDRGVFALVLDSTSEGPALPWLNSIFGSTQQLLDRMCSDIAVAEALLPLASPDQGGK
jgi:hypothetical protein